MKRSFALSLILVSAILDFQCSHPYFPDYLDVRFETIAIAPLIDSSNLELAPRWPDNDLHSEILFKILKDIAQDLWVELNKYKQHGRYRVVQYDQFPSITVEIKLESYQVKNDSLSIPMRLKIVSKKARHPLLEKKYDQIVGPDQTSLTDNDYYFWGSMLRQYRKKIPRQEIIQFFVPRYLSIK